MLKIVPAVISTVLLSFLSISTMAQPGFHSGRKTTKVIIVHENDDWDNDRRTDRKHRKAPPRRAVGYHKKMHAPLVIVDTRHLPIRRYSGNRYYYRTPAGLHYWVGRNGHLYLDAKFVNRDLCDSRDYAMWNRGRM